MTEHGSHHSFGRGRSADTVARRWRVPLGAFVVAHLAAAAACGCALALAGLARMKAHELGGCTANCIGVVSSLPMEFLGTILFAISAIGFAMVFMIPATIVLCPAAFLVATRVRSQAWVVLAGAGTGFGIGLPVTIVTVASWRTERAGLWELVDSYIASLPDYGVAAALAGAAFSAVLVAMRR